MPTIDECRRNAEQTLHWADEAANDEQRETLLEIARLWTQIELSTAEPNGVDGLLESLKSQDFQRRQSRSSPRHPRGSKARHTSRRQAVHRSPFVPLRVFEYRRGLWDQKSPALHHALGGHSQRRGFSPTF